VIEFLSPSLDSLREMYAVANPARTDEKFKQGWVDEQLFTPGNDFLQQAHLGQSLQVDRGRLPLGEACEPSDRNGDPCTAAQPPLVDKLATPTR